MTASGDDEQEQARRRFRVTNARLGLAATALLAGIAFAFVGETAATGVLLGGIAGVLGIWMMTARFQRLATTAPEKLHAAMIAGTYLRLTVYAMFLYIGYQLDPVRMHGFFGALAALLSIRFVPIFVAIAQARSGRVPSQSVEHEDR